MMMATTTTTATTAGSESDCSSSMMMDSTPSLSPSSGRDDEFMNEETYSFELMDDDDELDGSLNGSVVGLGGGGGLRSMEDEWRFEGFEDEDEFEEDDEEDDEDEDYDDLYGDDDDDDEEDEDEVVDEVVVEGDGTGNRKKKGDVSSLIDQDQDPDAEGEMEIDIEPFQDPSFNAELSSPTSPTSPSIITSPKLKSRSKSEPQSFVSSFYIPPVPPHVQHIMQMQQQQQQREEEAPALVASSLDPSTSSLSSPSSEGTPTFDAVDQSSTATPSNNESNHTPMQIHLPPAPQHPHHYHHSQLIQFSSNILPLPPPRLDSVRVFILRQSEMGGLKTTGRGTPADRKRGAIWCGVQVGGGSGGGNQEVGTTSGSRKRDRKESESESDEESGGEDDEGGKRGRPRLRLMLSDHDIESGGVSREEREGGGDGAKTSLRHKPSATSTPSSTTSFVTSDQTWDAFLASLDDKNNHHQQQPPPQQQGEVGTLDSCVSAADSDVIVTHGQLLLDVDDGHLLPNQHRLHRDASTRRLGPTLSPTSLEGSSGMFMFDHRDDSEEEDSTRTWFGDEGLGGRSSGGSGPVVVVGSSSSSSGTCPSDALAMEGFNFPVGPDGSSTLSYALG